MAICQVFCWLTRSPNRWTRPMFTKVFTDYFRGDFKTFGKQVYYEHYSMVRKLVPKYNLLEYDVEDGWEPLCKFLDVPIPDVPFPKGNCKRDLDRRIRRVVDGEVRRLGRFLCSAILALWVLVRELLHDASDTTYFGHVNK
ncbi:hypothetical protein LTR96_011298 [Exophiala xenobiotica]|nr:hypothetical protein LTR92_011361 [Exophiala xenobiotica]KAK5263280.1 hypothetical protein LTR96_011298 [Exophiala xenobiotica]KAK5311420.1 hypothetical protein LTR93_011725 [Exophiala xenobiotica]KAK5332536.1 hypothetical protein LTR98_011336 [Exophiala xenobiotica]